ncbi:MAG TPA: hypothetical protein VE398_26100, partial [Acidobacteriota bacterium]|nr:hypothetical protein [Acidobacteriota bacterium]
MKVPSLIRYSFALLTLLVLATGLEGQDATHTKFGNFLFKVPNGWNPVQKEDAMLLVAPASRPGTATYIALAASDLQGNLQESFNEFLTGIQKAYRIPQGGKAMPLHSKKNYDAYIMTALATDKDSKQWNLYLVGIQYGKRFEGVAFLSDLPASDSTYDAYLDTFMAFLDDLSFEDTPSAMKAPGDPPKSPRDSSRQLPLGELQGVYVCTGGADGRPTNKQYIFYPDGLMVYGIPQEGMLGFDFEHYRPQSNPTKNWVGRYQVDGDKVRIVWQNQFGDPARPVLIKINEASAHPAWDAGWDTFIPMCSCTGKTFSGTYRWG